MQSVEMDLLCGVVGVCLVAMMSASPCGAEPLDLAALVADLETNFNTYVENDEPLREAIAHALPDPFDEAALPLNGSGIYWFPLERTWAREVGDRPLPRALEGAPPVYLSVGYATAETVSGGLLYVLVNVIMARMEISTGYTVLIEDSTRTERPMFCSMYSELPRQDLPSGERRIGRIGESQLVGYVGLVQCDGPMPVIVFQALDDYVPSARCYLRLIRYDAGENRWIFPEGPGGYNRAFVVFDATSEKVIVIGEGYYATEDFRANVAPEVAERFVEPWGYENEDGSITGFLVKQAMVIDVCTGEEIQSYYPEGLPSPTPEPDGSFIPPDVYRYY